MVMVFQVLGYGNTQKHGQRVQFPATMAAQEA